MLVCPPPHLVGTSFFFSPNARMGLHTLCGGVCHLLPRNHPVVAHNPPPGFFEPPPFSLLCCRLPPRKFFFRRPLSPGGVKFPPCCQKKPHSRIFWGGGSSSPVYPRVSPTQRSPPPFADRVLFGRGLPPEPKKGGTHLPRPWELGNWAKTWGPVFLKEEFWTPQRVWKPPFLTAPTHTRSPLSRTGPLWVFPKTLAGSGLAPRPLFLLREAPPLPPGRDLPPFFPRPPLRRDPRPAFLGTPGKRALWGFPWPPPKRKRKEFPLGPFLNPKEIPLLPPRRGKFLNLKLGGGNPGTRKLGAPKGPAPGYPPRTQFGTPKPLAPREF